MQRAIMNDQTPNLFLLHYQIPQFKVENVLLIPHFAFSLSCVEKRNALSSKARRAGYVGCYFLLDRIPLDAKIPVILAGKVLPYAQVRRAYRRVKPLEQLGFEKRGWTLDVLNVVRSLEKEEFSLREIYDRADALAQLHPQNRHVHDKIRQQLQVLRDLGLLTFLGHGSYCLR